MSAHIRQAAGDAVGVAWQDVRLRLRPVLTYQSNRLYDAHVASRHLIVKEFLKPEEFEEAPVREFEGLRLLAPLDVAPQPLLFRPHGPRTRPLVVYEFMPGAMWDRRVPSTEELQKLAALWLRVNDVGGDDLWPSRAFEQPLSAQARRFARIYREYADWAGVAFPAGVQAAEMCLSTLQQRASLVGELEASSALRCFCRADARFANVIARPGGRLGLVDWEDCGLRDPALDLADAVTAPNQEDLLDWQDWQPFLQTYLPARQKHDSGLERRMHLYLALYPLAWLCYLLSAGVAQAQQGRLADWLIHDMAPNARLRRYLARARAWPARDIEKELQQLVDVHFFPEPLA